MTGFCDEAWQANAPVRAAISRLPFITELTAGTLSAERFRFYITQDALYLDRFARALALAAAKGPDPETLEAFIRWALGAVAVERALHRHYLAEFGVDAAAIATAEPAPDCFAYTSFLLAVAGQEPWEVLVAALVPCFRVYWEVGCGVAGSAAPDNRYRAWIDTYADEAFGEAVRAIITVADRAAAASTAAVRARMSAAFARACSYEYLFWDGAYQRRDWPAFG
jgi:thiaminase/transcriptional activator TenA